MKFIWFLLISFLIPASYIGVLAKTYSNEDWGMTIPYPPNAGKCPIPHQDGQSHGPFFLLDTPHPSRAVCESEKLTRSISVFALYNVTDDTATLTDFFRYYCHSEDTKGTLVPGYKDFQFGPLKSMSVRTDFEDGWIQVDVCALGEPIMESDGYPNDLAYVVTLLTNHKHFERDAALFRRFLEHIVVKMPH